MDGSEETETDVSSGRSDSIPDKLVDEMDFGELCNEFECISSPSVEAVARQLVRDILELRQENRALGCFAVFVKYKVYTCFLFLLFVILIDKEVNQPSFIKVEK